jgi:hypothetical protein
MSESPQERVEFKIGEIARAFPYPPTPDISGGVTRRLAQQGALRRRPVPSRRLAWALLVVAILFGALLAVPPVRAQILEFIQVGIVRIFVGERTPTPAPDKSEPTQPAGGGESPDEATPLPGGQEIMTPTPGALLDLDGQVTLDQARAEVDFPILAPTYPEGVGLPDGVFLQDMGGQTLIMVWMDPERPDQVLFSLHELGPGSYSAEKVQPAILEQTVVNGETAYWTTGPYLFRLKNGDHVIRRLIRGHVLIWADGEITYRLETSLALEEAVRMAESLRPIPEEHPLPTPTQVPLAPLAGLEGETTLEEARARVDFEIRLPASPADLGDPDRVYLQEGGSAVLALVWLDPDDPARARLALVVHRSDAYAGNRPQVILLATNVHGLRAIWTESAHFLRLSDRAVQGMKFIENSQVLVWEEGSLFYRLESGLPVGEARRVAESLQ